MLGGPAGQRRSCFDAAANALLIVDHRGNIDWVATLPSELVSTDNVKYAPSAPTAKLSKSVAMVAIAALSRVEGWLPRCANERYFQLRRGVG
jgi:hypothetical protein